MPADASSAHAAYPTGPAPRDVAFLRPSRDAANQAHVNGCRLYPVALSWPSTPGAGNNQESVNASGPRVGAALAAA